MLNWELIMGLGIAVGLIVVIRLVFPIFQDRETIYKDVKGALLLFGYAVRDEKLKFITDSVFKVVSVLEAWDVANEDKKFAATEVAYRTLIEEFGLDLEPQAIDLIVEIAVSYLPKSGRMIDLDKRGVQ